MATLYRVFRETAAAGSFAPHTEVEASSAEQAIRKAVEKQSERGADATGVYAACPARSWVEQRVTVESKPRIVLEDTPAQTMLAVVDDETAELAEAAAGERTDAPPESAKRQSRAGG
jgi:hypothetical protein